MHTHNVAHTPLSTGLDYLQGNIVFIHTNLLSIMIIINYYQMFWGVLLTT